MAALDKTVLDRYFLGRRCLPTPHQIKTRQTAGFCVLNTDYVFEPTNRVGSLAGPTMLRITK